MNSGSRLGLTLLAGTALIAAHLGTEPVAAQITITETISPAFGFVMGGPANRRFVLDTNDAVTGPNAADYLFGAVSGELIVQRQGGPTLVYVLAENITSSGGVTANSIRCKWHNTPEVSCDGIGILRIAVGRRRLLLGVDMTTTQFHNGGDRASVSFDITAALL